MQIVGGNIVFNRQNLIKLHQYPNIDYRIINQKLELKGCAILYAKVEDYFLSM